MKIFIDAGHNPHSYNTGASGFNLKEQDVVFSVALKLADILKNYCDIKLSRPTANTMLGTNNSSAVNARWKMANDWKADYFISLHNNAGGGTGAETLYYRQDSKNFANAIHSVYVKEMNLKDRGLKYRDNLAVLNKTNMPSILIELAFIDTKSDNEILKNKQSEIAKAIAKGIISFLKLEKKTVDYKIINSPLKIEDTIYNFDKINSNNTNYVKLRDFAQAGYKIDYIDNTPTINLEPKPIKIKIQEKEFEILAVSINGNNYIKLQDLSKANFDVNWNNKTFIKKPKE